MLSYIALAALFSRARSTDCTDDTDCPQYGFKCDTVNDQCYAACSDDNDCNAIWGYNNATCTEDADANINYCSPGNLIAEADECSVDDDCPVAGFSCFNGTSLGLTNFCYPGCEDQDDCDAIGALAGYSCVEVDYVAFSTDICTASPTNYACDSDADCDGDLKCFGSGPASLCYMGCDGNDFCATGYECVIDDFGFGACRPEGLDIACTDTCVGVNADGLLDGYTCVGGACAPLCTEGDDSSCDDLTGVGSTCLTMGDSTGQKLSVCYDAALSTAATPTTTATPTCSADSDCPQYGFKCETATGFCYPACSDDEDCNAIWGYEGATCTEDADNMINYCSPGNLIPETDECTVDDDCEVDGFSCFNGTSLDLTNFCYPGCSAQADCDAIDDMTGYSCVNVDYVAFSADICTASPSNYACDTDDDCSDDLKCFGSGPASVCYMGCDSNDDCATGGDVDYECVTDDFGFSACRPADLDIACTDTCDGLLDGFTCVGGACAPLCTEGDDSSCDALTGEGSTCLTMGDSTGQKLSVCYDAALSTATTPAPVTPAPVTPAPTSETAACSADSDCPQYGFKCSAGGSCYPACTTADDCNAIWGYGGATCEFNNASTATTEDDFNYCSPLNLAGLTSCSLDTDCPGGFSCSTLLGDPGFCYPPCTSDDDCTGDLDGYSCVEVDYVAFSDNICTAPPTNYACDSDDDCEGDLKCFGSGPASLCYMGCDSDDDCETTATGAAVDYACVTDPFGFSACRPAVYNVSCTDTCVGVDDANLLDDFTCVGGACAPVCTEGDDSSCDALTGVGSTCVTMDDGTGQKLSVCYDAALSTISATPAPTTEDSSAAATHMVLVALSAAAALALAQE